MNPNGQAAMMKKMVRDTYRIVGIGIACLLLFVGANISLTMVSEQMEELAQGHFENKIDLQAAGETT